MVVGAGVVLTQLVLGFEPRFLLLRGRDSGVWSFPKGHPELEDEGMSLRTAMRETFEETGFSAGNEYQIVGDSMRFGKRPYWLGIMNGDHIVRVCRDEHTVGSWFTHREIDSLTTNTDVRAWHKKTAGGHSSFMRALSSFLPLPSDMQSTHSISQECIES
jgi:8-oxo-dGTP pyrophosphatase MutT (NUDIX family)